MLIRRSKQLSTTQRPISIDFVISAIFTQHAGTEGHLLRLMKRLKREEYSPHLVVLQDSPWTAAYSDPETPMTSLGFQSFLRPSGWLTIKKLADFFRERHTKVVELHAADAHFAGGLAAYLAKVPVVISCRRSSGHQYGIKQNMMLRFANRYVTRFMANAQFVADKACEDESIPRDRFDVIYNGVDLRNFDHRKSGSVRPEFEAFCQGKRVVCSTGNMRPVKNIGCFVRACGEIAKTHDDVVFAMLGEGPERPKLENVTRELGIHDRTMWLGATPDIVPYLMRSEVACLSSDSEGFSNSILEYMAAELPVVATNVGGNPEAIDEGVTGFTCEPGDHGALAQHVRMILDLDEQSRTRMGRAGAGEWKSGLPWNVKWNNSTISMIEN